MVAIIIRIFFFGGTGVLNSGPLPLEPHLPFCSDYFGGDGGLINYLPSLSQPPK
jgi:hypothetical protein